MKRPKVLIDYARPDEIEREPPQWWVLALIIALGMVIMLAIFLLTLN